MPIGAVSALAISPSGALLVADPNNDAIWQIKGTFISLAAKAATSALAVDPSGALYYERNYAYPYAWEAGWSPIYKLSPAGDETQLSYTYRWGSAAAGDGGPATDARLAYPAGLALDRNGTLYIADQGDSLIRTLDADGLIHSFEPLGGSRGESYVLAGETAISAPEALSFDSAGNMFVADSYKIRKVTPKGVVSDYLFTRRQDASRASAPSMTSPPIPSATCSSPPGRRSKRSCPI